GRRQPLLALLDRGTGTDRPGAPLAAAVRPFRELALPGLCGDPPGRPGVRRLLAPVSPPWKTSCRVAPARPGRPPLSCPPCPLPRPTSPPPGPTATPPPPPGSPGRAGRSGSASAQRSPGASPSGHFSVAGGVEGACSTGGPWAPGSAGSPSSG